MFFARFYDLPVLETPRLTLRALTLQDAPRLFAYGRRPETTTFTLWDPHRSLADAQAFVADAMRAREEGLPHPWGVVERASGLLVGTAGFASLQLAHASGEVGYALDPDYWGRGYATEALHAVLQSGFQDFSCNRIEARCIAEHAASARVMEKAGMRYEGLLRQALFVKGAYRDIKIFSLLAAEAP